MMIAEELAATDPARIAAAIGEPARARMLYCLLDGRARTSTELALVAGVSPSTASTHLHRLAGERLVAPVAAGKHRYYRLGSPDVARVLDGLSTLAGDRGAGFVPSRPSRLRLARTCYDHIAGNLAVALHDEFLDRGWLVPSGDAAAYGLSAAGGAALTELGIDVAGARAQRRRFAYACLDWSDRRGPPRPRAARALGRPRRR
jgi:DNA-binding transcriptional ArsR family regulator